MCSVKACAVCNHYYSIVRIAWYIHLRNFCVLLLNWISFLAFLFEHLIFSNKEQGSS
jgi:hypothetical protein